MAGPDATGADLDGHDAAVFNRFYFLKIRVPYGTGFVVGVAYVIAEAGAFTADIAFSGHTLFLQSVIEWKHIAD